MNQHSISDTFVGEYLLRPSRQLASDTDNRPMPADVTVPTVRVAGGREDENYYNDNANMQANRCEQ